MTDGYGDSRHGDLPADPVTARPRRSRTVTRWVVLSLVPISSLLYGAAYVYADDRLPRDTRIEGVEVGGLSPAAAERLLERQLGNRGAERIEVEAGGQVHAIDPEEVGLRVDVAASVDQVPVERSLNPALLWRVVSGGEEHEAVVVADEDRLAGRLARLADQVDRPVREGVVKINADGPIPTYPRAGRALDEEAAEAAILAAFPATGVPVNLDLQTVQPQVTVEEVDRALREFAEPAVAAPVILSLAGDAATIRPGTYASMLSMRTDGSRLVPAVDGDALARRAAAALRSGLVAPRDATVEVIDGRPRVVPSRSGTSLDRNRLADDFLTAVAAEGADRKVQVRTTSEAPTVSTAEARSWGVREVVSSFTTYYPHADYRNVNIGRAARLIDGTVVLPGELFSFNETVGERTAANGFTRGFVISNGIFAEDYGGGVSQMATTTFNAAFFAGLEDVEHKPHSFYIDRYPVGREATVAWPTVDLRFRNDTEYAVLIETRHSPSTPSTSGSVTVRMWSTKVWDIGVVTSERYNYTAPGTRIITGEDCFPNTGYSGFDVDVTRVFRVAGRDAVHHREQMHTTYIPSDTVICR